MSKNPVNNGINYQPQLVLGGVLNHQPYQLILGIDFFIMPPNTVFLKSFEVDEVQNSHGGGCKNFGHGFFEEKNAAEKRRNIHNIHKDSLKTSLHCNVLQIVRLALI